MNKKVLLIGGNGFIGRHIQKEITHNKNWIASCIDKEDVELTKSDSIKKIRELISHDHPDVIVILAAIKRQDKEGPEIKALNNSITIHLSRALDQFNGQIIYFSSCAVYGEKNEQKRVTERTELKPTSDYGDHKKYSEQLYTARKSQKASLLIVRPPLVYSCDELLEYSPGGFLSSAIKYGKIALWGDGNEIREFIHVSDIARITARLIENKCTGIINLVSGHSYSYREVAEYIRTKIIVEIACKERTGAKVNHTYDNNEVRKAIPDFEFTSPFTAIDNELKKG